MTLVVERFLIRLLMIIANMSCPKRRVVILREVLTLVLLGFVPLLAAGQPDLGRIERDASGNWHPDSSDITIRYHIPVGYQIATDLRDSRELNLTKYEIPPSVNDRERLSLRGGTLRFRIVESPGADSRRSVPLVWRGVGVKVPGGNSLRVVSAAHPSPAPHVVNVPLEATQVDILWSAFENENEPLPVQMRALAVYSGLWTVSDTGTYTVDRATVWKVMKRTNGSFDLGAKDATQDLILALIKAGAITPIPRDPSPTLIQALFAGVRADMLSYLVSTPEGNTPSLAVRVREKHDKGTFKLLIPEKSYGERTVAVGINLTSMSEPIRRKRNVLRIPFDGTPITEKVEFSCDLPLVQNEIQQVFVDCRYDEGNTGKTSKRLKLKADIQSVTWNFQIRYPSKGKMSYRLTVVRAPGSMGKRFIQSGWVPIKNPPWNFAVPTEYVFLNGQILNLLENPEKPSR